MSSPSGRAGALALSAPPALPLHPTLHPVYCTAAGITMSAPAASGGTPSTYPATPATPQENAEAIKTLNSIIKGCRTCMVTTHGEYGLHSRPMATAGIDFDDNREHIYFVTDKESVKVQEIRTDPRIALVFSNDAANSWATVSAQATVVDDSAKVRELWNPIYNAYFPSGPDTPEVVLIKCEPVLGSYWQGSHLTRWHIMFSALKARITGKPINQAVSQEQKTAVFASTEPAGVGTGATSTSPSTAVPTLTTAAPTAAVPESQPVEESQVPAGVPAA